MPDVTIGVNRDLRGGLDSDTDIHYLNGGNYQDCVNVERNESGTTGSDTPSLGTRLQYEIPEQQVQDQKVRIYIKSSDYPNGFDWIRVTLYNGNGQIIKNDYIDATGIVNSDIGIRGSIINMLAISGFSFLTYTIGSNTTDSEGTYIIDLMFDFFYDDWTIEVVPEQLLSRVPIFYNNGEGGGRITSITSGPKPIIPATSLEPFQTRILQEAISETGAGKYHLIGSRENNSLLFMTWTTQTKERTRLNLNLVGISAGTVNNGVIFRGIYVRTDIPHGLQTNESVILANLSGVANIYNGEWTITVVSDTVFYLNTALATVDISNIETNYGGQLYVNPYGLGAFLVQRYDIQANVYRYEIPLRSKKLNWITTKQIDLDVEYFNQVYSLYYNDFYNRPRVTYFQGDLFLDCAIEAINPQFGRYSYEQLIAQIRLQEDTASVTIELRDQIQTGGSLNSGSYRYGVILVTEEFTETEISDLTDQVNVYAPEWPGFGADANTTFTYLDNPYGTYSPPPTPKVNQIYVSDIPPGIYKYIDLIAVYITGADNNITATEAQIVSRTQIGPDQTEVLLKHSGNETDIRSFSLAGLNPVRQSILKAYNNIIGENRLLISNFETSQRFDISEWASQFKYSIKKYETYGDYGGTNIYTYAAPFNNQGGQYTPVGYQFYEWYRFFVVAEFKEGGFTDATFCFDIRFVTQQDYIDSYGTEDDFRFLNTNITDRRDFNGDELITYNFGRGDRYYYQYGIELKGINWDFSINGVKAKDLFRRLKICRAERVKEVLSCGVSAWSYAKVYSTSQGIKQSQIEECKLGTIYGVMNPFPNYFLYTRSSENILQSEFYIDYLQSVVSYHSPDILFGNDEKILENDTILDLGPIKSTSNYYQWTPTIGPNPAQLDDFWIINNPLSTNVASDGIIDDQFYINERKAGVTKVLFASFVETGQSVDIDTIASFGPATDSYGHVIDPIKKYTKGATTVALLDPNQFTLNTENSILVNGNREGSYVLHLNQPLKKNLSIDLANGNYGGGSLTLHYRRLTNKYGISTANNDVIFTGFYIDNGESNKFIFGGDVYNQQTWIKQVFPKTSAVTVDGFGTDVYIGAASGCNVITTNTVNTQLRVYDNTNTTNPAFPFVERVTWVEDNDVDQISQNAAYTINKSQQLFPVFDPNQITRSVFPTRIIWSELKPNGSVKDFYRVFPPGQFRDNPNNYGAITHMDIKQGELFTLQELCYTREFLNSTGRLSTIEDGSVIIGDASVLSRPGIRLTQLGSKHKWSYARGLTDAGTDVRCWVNTDFFVVLRAGRDGTVNLTERAMMDTFLRDHMRFVKDKFTPADNQGIHAVWDDVGKNFIITCRAWIDHDAWSATASGYKKGQVVSYGDNNSIPILYLCTQNIAAEGPNTRPGEPTVATAIPGSEIGADYWERKEFSDGNYYSVWTLAFNEARNRFIHFQTFYPKIYANHFDRYFSPSPFEGESNRFFLMRDSEPLVFYDRDNEGYSEYVINQENNILKKFVSIAYNSVIKPFKVELKTLFISEQGAEERVTVLNRDEFKVRENITYSTIKNSLDSNGQTNQRTAPMKGLWLKIKTFYKARENQKINDIFVPIRTGQRNIKNP